VWDPHLEEEAHAGAAEIFALLAQSGMIPPVGQAEAVHALVQNALTWRLIRTLILGGAYHNLGVVPLRGVTTDDGRPVTVFRTGLTARPSSPTSCFRSLLDSGRVRHVVNLYTGAMPTADLEKAEQEAVMAAGGTYFLARDLDDATGNWRESLRAASMGRQDTTPEARTRAMAAVAAIINEQVLHPAGAKPRGNIHVHCGGGMHRTGMIVGVVDRCINGSAPESLVRDYRRHTAWKSDNEPGGYERANVDFILDFDCSLLRAD
jgi:hypothetical protein